MVKEQSTKTAGIAAESLLDWGVEVIFGLPGDGTNGFRGIVTKKDR
jgi:pyruvate dehydrogenase (quinone)/pyruvate oxidase